MNRIRLVSGAAALMMAGSLFAAPASAGDRLSPGGAAALGAVGGLAIGLGIAAAQQPAYAAPVPVYVAPEPAPVYVERPTRVIRERVVRVEEEDCYVERFREWVPGWGWQVRRRTVCH